MMLPYDEIQRMIALMEESAREENERLEAMTEDERVEYLRDRDAAMEQFRQHLINRGVPPEQIAVGTAELLVSLQKALDGKPPTIH